MKTTDLLLQRVDKIVRKLSNQLSENDIDGGWCEESRLAMLKFFETLRDDLLNGVDVSTKAEYASIARGMDHWGIVSGQLLEEATGISAEIRKF